MVLRFLYVYSCADWPQHGEAQVVPRFVVGNRVFPKPGSFLASCRGWFVGFVFFDWEEETSKAGSKYQEPFVAQVKP